MKQTIYIKSSLELYEMRDRNEDSFVRFLNACESLHVLALGTFQAPLDQSVALYMWLHKAVTKWRVVQQTKPYDDLVLGLAKRSLLEFKAVFGKKADLPAVPA